MIKKIIQLLTVILFFGTPVIAMEDLLLEAAKVRAKKEVDKTKSRMKGAASSLSSSYEEGENRSKKGREKRRKRSGKSSCSASEEDTKSREKVEFSEEELKRLRVINKTKVSGEDRKLIKNERKAYGTRPPVLVPEPSTSGQCCSKCCCSVLKCCCCVLF